MARYYTVLFTLSLFSDYPGTSDAFSRPSAIVLENNQFKNILVALDDNVPDDPALVDTIKDTFTKASAFLYSATEQRAVFRDVTILVPAKWSNGQGAYGKATSQVFNNADVIFSRPVTPTARSLDASRDAARSDDGGSPRASRSADFPPGGWPTINRPPATTKVYAGCGHPAVRITLTTDVLTDSNLHDTLGPPEKVLVHEWAHYRWGVFDEYALEDEPQFYFSPSTGKLEGVRCTEKIHGILFRINPATGGREYCRTVDPNTGLYPEGCKFLPYPAGPLAADIEASIMDHLTIRSMSKFCNDDKANDATRHNYDAPSRHNRLCGHRSTWDVITSSPDFSGGSNGPRAGVDTTPTFTVVQASASRRLVLALDSSQSMADDERLTRMKQAVATFVQNGLAPATEVGLTTFSDTLHVERAPLTLNTSREKQAFIDDLPEQQSGATDITLALTSAVKVLHGKEAASQTINPENAPPSEGNAANSTSSPSSRHRRDDTVTSFSNGEGGHVVVITDGQSTSGRPVHRSLPMLRSAGVVVSFLLLGGSPHPDLDRIASETGGKVYCDGNAHSSTAATSALFDVQESYHHTDPNSPVQVTNLALSLSPHKPLEGSVAIDKDIGEKTSFLVTYDVKAPTVTLTSPLGRVYSARYPEYSLDQRLKLIRIEIPGRAESGRWSYEIVSPEVYQQVSLLVLSSPSNSSAQPVRLSGTVMENKDSSSSMYIFAEATRGHNAVTGLKVTALVHRPDGKSETFDLMDNGAGADIVENDGVYSRYFINMTQRGLYTVQLSATGNVPHQTHKFSSGESVDPRNDLVHRSVSAGYVLVSQDGGAEAGSGSDGDVEAPMRISDLRVVKTSAENRTVMLSWRASGDDADRDTASRYEVYMAPSVRDLMQGTALVTSLTQHDVVHGSLAQPKPFGAREFVMLRVPRGVLGSRLRLVFSVVAVDEAGNRGRHSNYVTVGLGGEAPDFTNRRYWAEWEDQAATGSLRAPKGQNVIIAGVLGTVSALLVIVIVVTVVVWLVSGRRRRDDPLSALRFSLNLKGQGFGSKRRGFGYGERHDVFAMS